jgi:hypothetical protein
MLVVQKRGRERTKEELLNYLADKVAKWWLPEDLVFVDPPAHTATGKLQKMAVEGAVPESLVARSVKCRTVRSVLLPDAALSISLSGGVASRKESRPHY